MATYSTDADPFIDAVEAGALSGVHGKSYLPASFGNTPKAQVAMIELCIAELCSALVDNASVTADQVATALKNNGNRIVALSQQSIGLSPQPGMVSMSSTGGGGGAITTAAGTEAVPAKITLVGDYIQGSVISVRVVTDVPSDDVVSITLAAASTATEAAALLATAIDGLTDTTATSTGAVVDVLAAVAGTVDLSEFSAQP